MGRNLVIRGADFLENCISQGENIQMKKSGWGVCYLNYSTTVNCIQRNRIQVAQPWKIFVFDVTDYVGRNVSITTCHPVVSGGSYCAFSADLGTLSFNDIPNLQGSQAPSNNPLNLQISTVENFNVSTTAKVKRTITKTIPTGTKYLLLTYANDGDLVESGVDVTLL